MSLDILFINPGNHKKTYQGLSKEFTAVATPMWTTLIAGYMRSIGFSIKIYDVNVEGWDQEIAKDVLSKHSPSLIVMMVYGHNPSASTQTMPAASRIAKDIKHINKDSLICMGGIHPSALPQKTLKEEPIDFVLQGEGVYALEDLFKYINGKLEFANVRGVWRRKDDLIELSSPPKIVKNLDQELSDYAWDLLPRMNSYRAHNMHCFQDFEKSATSDFSDVRSPYVAMNTSLGCPYYCSYCCINAIFGKPGIRYWSLETVVSWIDTLVLKYHVKNIRLDDELFILSAKRVEELCDILIERNYNLNIWVYGRVDTIQESMLTKLKKAGINWICLGIESGNAKVRNNVNKHIKKDIKNMVKLIQANDIYVLGNYMFGLPEDNFETMKETLSFAQELNCEFANFYSVMAYPGSKLYECLSEKEDFKIDSWEEFSQHGYNTKPLSTNYLPGRDILRFRDEAFNKYFTSDKYLLMVRKKFGSKVESHLNRMLSINIKRKLYSD